MNLSENEKTHIKEMLLQFLEQATGETATQAEIAVIPAVLEMLFTYF